jgi:hypothetical protein
MKILEIWNPMSHSVFLFGDNVLCTTYCYVCKASISASAGSSTVQRFTAYTNEMRQSAFSLCLGKLAS